MFQAQGVQHRGCRCSVRRGLLWLGWGASDPLLCGVERPADELAGLTDGKGWPEESCSPPPPSLCLGGICSGGARLGFIVVVVRF